MPTDPTVTLFRQSANAWPGATTVHVVGRQQGFMLCSPSPCHTVLAEILAEKVTVSRDVILAHDRADLERRGYCRHCLGTLSTG